MQEYLYNLATDRSSGIIPSILRFFLFLLSFIYELIIRLILLFYKIGIFKKQKLACKVISIGNITLGGTGKTPLVETVAKYLIEKGIKVAILTRGYKRELSKDKTSDEASMLAKNIPEVPVLVGGNRIKNAMKAIKEHNVGVVILDDAFQQWRIKKDLEILTIDSTNPFGNRKLIPRGLLREPFSSLVRADIFIATKADFGLDNLAKIKFILDKIKPNSLLVETVHNPISLVNMVNNENVDAARLTNKKVCLVAGIGDPETFEKTILKLGLKPTLRFYFLDHYQYERQDLERIIQACKENEINTIITTEKDIPRIREISLEFPEGISVCALRIGIKITKNGKAFFERLDYIFNG